MRTHFPRLVAATVLLCSATALDAQTAINVTLVKHWRRTSGGYNDIWGWTSPTGREFAYVGERSGIWFVETTDPTNIKQVGWWSAPTSTWRDFANVGPYVYAVSEHHRGIRIIDMTNPDVPKDLGYVHQGAITNTHNITADPATGLLYLSGTNQGLAIFDASTSPTNPTFVSSWKTNYTHDCCVLRGRGYFSNGSNKICRIMDVSNPTNMVEIGRCPTPGDYDHNVWVSEDDKLLCITDEISNGPVSPHMTVWDISNPQSPVKRGDYDLNSVAHNVFIIGRTAYMSYYTDGFHMIDLGDPTKPTRLASYDTSTYNGGYNGCWGVHAFTDHGLVYASDIQNGLYVFQIDCGHMNRYEAGTPGSNGVVPRARFDGASPRVGASGLRLEVEGMQPNAPFALLVSDTAGKTSVLGVQANVDLSRSMFIYLQADAKGNASIPTPIPPNGGLANAKIYMQIVAADAGNPQGFSASRGMWAGICP